MFPGKCLAPVAFTGLYSCARLQGSTHRPCVTLPVSLLAEAPEQVLDEASLSAAVVGFSSEVWGSLIAMALAVGRGALGLVLQLE